MADHIQNALVFTFKLGMPMILNPGLLSPLKMGQTLLLFKDAVLKAFPDCNAVRTDAYGDVIRLIFKSTKRGAFLQAIGAWGEISKEVSKCSHFPSCSLADFIHCGIAQGEVMFDNELVIGDVINQSTKFSEEAVRLGFALVMGEELVPDLPRIFPIEVYGKKVIGIDFGQAHHLFDTL